MAITLELELIHIALLKKYFKKISINIHENKNEKYILLNVCLLNLLSVPA